MSKREFWFRVAGFNYTEEFNVYLYLCGRMKTRKRKKVPFKFHTYTEWRKYIKEKYNMPSCLLIEFEKYLNLCIQDINISEKFEHLLLIPILVASLSVSNQYLTDVEFWQALQSGMREFVKWMIMLAEFVAGWALYEWIVITRIRK